MDQFLVKSEKPGLDFVASMPEHQRSLKDVRPGEKRLRKGILQGFKVVRDKGKGRMLPVLRVEDVDGIPTKPGDRSIRSPQGKTAGAF